MQGPTDQQIFPPLDQRRHAGLVSGAWPWALPSVPVSAAELGSSVGSVGLVVVSSLAMLLAIIGLVRVSGLRTFSKMSSFDFAVTVAFGSLLASVALSGSSLLDGLVAAASLLGLQALIAHGRNRWGLGRVVDNEPLLLMRDGELLAKNLRRARVTPSDVRAKLREANVRRYDEVDAVVLETTGDISVLHGSGVVEPRLLADVRSDFDQAGTPLRGHPEG